METWRSRSWLGGGGVWRPGWQGPGTAAALVSSLLSCPPGMCGELPAVSEMGRKRQFHDLRARCSQDGLHSLLFLDQACGAEPPESRVGLYQESPTGLYTLPVSHFLRVVLQFPWPSQSHQLENPGLAPCWPHSVTLGRIREAVHCRFSSVVRFLSRGESC